MKEWTPWIFTQLQHYFFLFVNFFSIFKDDTSLTLHLKIKYNWTNKQINEWTNSSGCVNCDSGKEKSAQPMFVDCFPALIGCYRKDFSSLWLDISVHFFLLPDWPPAFSSSCSLIDCWCYGVLLSDWTHVFRWWGLLLSDQPPVFSSSCSLIGRQCSSSVWCCALLSSSSFRRKIRRQLVHLIGFVSPLPRHLASSPLFALPPPLLAAAAPWLGDAP